MSEPNAVMFVRNYLIERDEALAPGEADDDERMESAREIVEGVRKSLSASLPADAAELVEPLSMSMFVNTDHMLKRLYSDRTKAASLIQSQAARIAELEAGIGEFAEPHNWIVGGRFDPHSGNFDAFSFARALLNRRAEG